MYSIVDVNKAIFLPLPLVHPVHIVCALWLVKNTQLFSYHFPLYTLYI